MRIAIIGSRDYPNMQHVRDYITPLSYDVTIVSGGARGVDREAVGFAGAIGHKTDVFPADWDKHGKSAGMIRNKQMLGTVDKVVAFWDGESKGTRQAIDYARSKGIPVVVYGVDGVELMV